MLASHRYQLPIARPSPQGSHESDAEPMAAVHATIWDEARSNLATNCATHGGTQDAGETRPVALLAYVVQRIIEEVDEAPLQAALGSSDPRRTVAPRGARFRSKSRPGRRAAAGTPTQGAPGTRAYGRRKPWKK